MQGDSPEDWLFFLHVTEVRALAANPSLKCRKAEGGIKTPQVLTNSPLMSYKL